MAATKIQNRISKRIGVKYFPMASITEFSLYVIQRTIPKKTREVIHCGASGKYDCTKISCVDAPVRGTAKMGPIKRTQMAFKTPAKTGWILRPTASALPPRVATTITATTDSRGSLIKNAKVAVPQFSPAVTPR